MVFETWDEAASKSKQRRAVADFGMVPDRNGKLQKAEIIASERDSAYVVYRHTGIRIRKATAAEVDGLKRWKPI